MSEAKKCPQCGAELKPDAPEGLCPACLLQRGVPTEPIAEQNKKPFAPPPLTELAALFPQLEILDLIGKGGMGAVYKARQKQLDRIVALKILPPGIGNDPAFAERFAREAKALAKLNHPGIVTLYEFGETNGQFYFLMEFVDGVNLRQLLNAGRISPREALAIVPQICDALQFAHDQGIVHRDIKPENILLDRRGRVKVADFGLAKIIVGRASRLSDDVNELSESKDGQDACPTILTDAGKIMGTPNYMAPEQKENPGEVDHRADIYALGVVFYQMLTGELPGKKIEPPSKKVQIDVRLDEIVLRALEKKPELRYQQVSVLKTQVETVAASEKSEAGNQKSEAEVRSAIAARKKTRGEFMGIGCAIQAIGLGCFFIPFIGPVLGIVLLIIGGRMAFKLVCSNCRERTYTEAETCAHCGSQFSQCFSRTAIVGVCWMAFMLIAFFAMFMPWTGEVTSYAGSVWWRRFCIFLFAHGLPMVNPKSTEWQILTLLPLCFIAPFGTTILGWMAVSQIRRSAGKLYGMWLAIFDGLFFPLLALDCLIWFICSVGAHSLSTDSFDPANRIRFAEYVFIVVIIICSLLDVLIIRLLWRVANKPVSPPVQKPDHFWRWFAAIVLAMISIPVVIAVFGLFAAIAIPNFVKGRQMALANQHRIDAANQIETSTNFFIGQTWFPKGDFIEITSVERNKNQMTVKGRYNLVSHDEALLALYVTTESRRSRGDEAQIENTKNNQRLLPSSPTSHQNEIKISKGRGDFELVDPNLVPGLPHISMYADGHPFASVYFGNKSEAAEESKAGWITNEMPTASQVDDEVAHLKLQIADNELKIARKKFTAEVTSQAGKVLSVSNIVALTKLAYATIYTYRDNGYTVFQYGDSDAWTNKFSELLGRKNYYRIEVVTAQHPFSQTNRWWSDGKTGFWQQDSSIISNSDNPATDSNGELSLLVNDSFAPALFFHFNWGDILTTLAYLTAPELVRQPDAVVCGIDCYVLAQTNQEMTVWIGKQDFLIRRFRWFIPKSTAAKNAKRFSNRNPSTAQDSTHIETHENIVINERLIKDDFLSPAVFHTNDK